MLAIVLAQVAILSSAGTAGEATKCSREPEWFHRFDLERRKLNDFLGATRNEYSKYQGNVAKQVMERIEVPDDPPPHSFVVKLDDGNWRFSGNQMHDGSAFGAVITDPCGHILAAGVVQYVGMRASQPSFELWVYLRHDVKYKELKSDFEAWPAAKGLATRITILPYRPQVDDSRS